MLEVLKQALSLLESSRFPIKGTIELTPQIIVNICSLGWNYISGLGLGSAQTINASGPYGVSQHLLEGAIKKVMDVEYRILRHANNSISLQFRPFDWPTLYLFSELEGKEVEVALGLHQLGLSQIEIQWWLKHCYPGSVARLVDITHPAYWSPGVATEVPVELLPVAFFANRPAERGEFKKPGLYQGVGGIEYHATELDKTSVVEQVLGGQYPSLTSFSGLVDLVLACQENKVSGDEIRCRDTVAKRVVTAISIVTGMRYITPYSYLEMNWGDNGHPQEVVTSGHSFREFSMTTPICIGCGHQFEGFQTCRTCGRNPDPERYSCPLALPFDPERARGEYRDENTAFTQILERTRKVKLFAILTEEYGEYYYRIGTGEDGREAIIPLHAYLTGCGVSTSLYVGDVVLFEPFYPHIQERMELQIFHGYEFMGVEGMEELENDEGED